MGSRQLAIVVALAACSGGGTRPIWPPPVDPKLADRVPFGPVDRAAELAFVRDAIRDGYAHLETKQKQWGFDLDAAFARYEPEIRAADTWTRYELVMVRFVSELHDGHVNWRRKRAATEAKRRIVRLGLGTQLVDDALIVSEVWPGSGAERAGLKVGERIVAIENDPVEDRLANLAKLRSWSRLENARYDFAQGWPARRIGATEPPKDWQLARERADGTRDTIAVAPETAPPAGRKRAPIELQPRGDVAILRVRDLGQRVAETTKLVTDAAAAIFARPGGLVVDLRDNGGGYENGALAIAARLTTGPIVAGTTRVRLSQAARGVKQWKDLREDAAKPGWSEPQPIRVDGLAPRAYPGKIAVLVDAGCRSSCETLALLLRAAGARLFGATTGGTGGAPITLGLPKSGARIRIPARAAYDLAGNPIEGAGVVPDEPLAATRDDVAAGRDPVLDRAVAFVCPGGASC